MVWEVGVFGCCWGLALSVVDYLSVSSVCITWGGGSFCELVLELVMVVYVGEIILSKEVGSCWWFEGYWSWSFENGEWWWLDGCYHRGSALLKEKVMMWSESLRYTGESEGKDTSYVMGNIWREILRIGRIQEVVLVITGRRLELVAVKVICESFVVRRMVGPRSRGGWVTRPLLAGRCVMVGGCGRFEVGVELVVGGGRWVMSGGCMEQYEVSVRSSIVGARMN